MASKLSSLTSLALASSTLILSIVAIRLSIADEAVFTRSLFCFSVSLMVLMTLLSVLICVDTDQLVVLSAADATLRPVEIWLWVLLRAFCVLARLRRAVRAEALVRMEAMCVFLE